MDNKEYLDSIKTMDLSKISLKELVQLDEMLQYYESFADLSVQREKINQEYLRRKSELQDLRFDVHEIKTGYKREDWADWEDESLTLEQKNKLRKRNYGWNGNFGWKFHLDVVPNRNHPVTKAISDFLIGLGVSHKIAHGGENGKGMTVYVGSYDDICKLAHIIQEKFGSQISKPPFYTDQVGQEHAFESKIYGRFCVRGARYPYDIVGISNWFEDYNKFNICYAKAVTLGELSSDEAVFFYPRTQRHSEKARRLSIYCSHKLYAYVYGQYYYGKSLEQFETDFLGNKVPAQGTKERKNWDEIASAFIEEFREMGRVDHLRKMVQGYVPLDLKEPQNFYSYTQNNTGRE